MTYNPEAATGGAWHFIETVTVSNQAAVEMDLAGSYSMYVLHIDNLVPITDGTYLNMRYSVDLGVSFLSGASDYAWSTRCLAPSLVTVVDAADSLIRMTEDGSGSFQNMGTATDESLNGFIYIHNAKHGTKAVMQTSQLSQLAEDNNYVNPMGRGALIANIDVVDAIQLYADTDNLNTGRVSLYGVD